MLRKVIVRVCRCLLGVFGIGTAAACGLGRVEYGTPYATFTVSGKVTDAAQNPVPGIVVTAVDKSASGQTASDGSFYLTGRSDYDFEHVQIAFSDIDGEENGGQFGTVTQEVLLTKTGEPDKDDSSWYSGEYSGSVDVTLEKQ